MELSGALGFARANRWAVLTTVRGNGLSQLSNVSQDTGDDNVIRISATADSSTRAGPVVAAPGHLAVIIERFVGG